MGTCLLLLDSQVKVQVKSKYLYLDEFCCFYRYLYLLNLDYNLLLLEFQVLQFQVNYDKKEKQNCISKILIPF